MTIADINNELDIRKAFQRVFTSPEGKEVLTLILNRLGYFAIDPAFIKADNIAAANWILNSLGAVHTENLFHITEMIADSSNDNDLQALKREIEKTGGIE